MKVKLLYIGKRLNSKNKVYNTFLKRGKEKDYLYFTGIKSIYIGCSYYAEMKPDGIHLSKRPDRIEDEKAIKTTEAQIDQWEALERSELEQLRVLNENKKKCREVKKAMQSKNIQTIIELIRPIVKKMSFIEAEFFATSLIRDARTKK